MPPQHDSERTDSEDAYPVLLGKGAGLGLGLGVLGVVIFLGITLATGYLVSLVGFLPAILGGYGVRRVAGDRAGVVTGLVAVLVGHGPVLALYGLLLSGFEYGVGRADVAVLLFGFVVAYKVGNGPDEDAADEGDEDVTGEDAAVAAAGDADLEGVDEERAAELLESDDPDPEELADALGAGGDGPASDDGTAGDFVDAGGED